MIRRSRAPAPRDVAALADGSLEAGRIAEVLEAVEASTRMSEELQAQQRAVKAIRRAREPASSGLRTRIAAAGGSAASAPRAPGGPRTLALTTGLAATLAAVALLIGDGGAVAPTVAQAAVLADRAPQAAVAEPRDDATVLPGLRAAGLMFPYWQDRFGLRGTGVRRDRVGGRLLTTVTYVHGRHVIAYTIASGTPLASGARTLSSAWDGVAVDMFSEHGRTVVTWERRGHTCVLTASGVPMSLLVALASGMSTSPSGA